jgi:capsid assembly protease
MTKINNLRAPKMARDYFHLRGLLYGRPHLLSSAKAFDIMEALKSRLGVEAAEVQPGVLTVNSEPLSTDLATIRVNGTMVNRALDAPSGMRSYEDIAAQIDHVAAMPSVGAIVLDLNSYGGEASGVFDLAQRVRAASQIKPVIAAINGAACSAGYALACAATRILATPDCITGSIGAVMIHEDESEANAKAGRRYTIISSGKKKYAGSSLEPLDPETLTMLQGMVEESHDRFVSLVSGMRGVTAEAINATESAVLTAQQALALGLIDEIVEARDMPARIATIVGELTGTQLDAPAAADPEDELPDELPAETSAPAAAQTLTIPQGLTADAVLKIAAMCAAKERSDLSGAVIAESMQSGIDPATILHDLLAAEAAATPISPMRHKPAQPLSPMAQAMTKASIIYTGKSQ